MLAHIFYFASLVVMYLSLVIGVVTIVGTILDILAVLLQEGLSIYLGRPKPDNIPNLTDIVVGLALSSLLLFITNGLAGWLNISLLS